MPYIRRQIINATLSATLVNLAELAGAATTKPIHRMPSIFVGHGSPMNALQSNSFTQTLEKWGRDIGQPTAILVVSAHWLTQNEINVTVEAHPKTIHYFGGFPKALFDMQYPAPGSPEFAKQAASLLASHGAKPSEEWGLDHGAWTVLHFMYPKAVGSHAASKSPWSRFNRRQHSIHPGRRLKALWVSGDGIKHSCLPTPCCHGYALVIGVTKIPPHAHRLLHRGTANHHKAHLAHLRG